MLSRMAGPLFIKKKSQIIESPSHQFLLTIILMIRAALSETAYEKQNLEDGLAQDTTAFRLPLTTSDTLEMDSSKANTS